MDKLKPCPFCGRNPNITQRPDSLDGYFCAISCYCNGYSARAHQAATGADEAEAYVKASMRWNRRTQPGNEPLTLDELRGLDGEPVWTVTNGLKGSGRWELVEFCKPKFDGQEIITLANLAEGQYDCFAWTYGQTWLAYRRKPEGGRPLMNKLITVPFSIEELARSLEEHAQDYNNHTDSRYDDLMMAAAYLREYDKLRPIETKEE